MRCGIPLFLIFSVAFAMETGHTESTEDEGKFAGEDGMVASTLAEFEQNAGIGRSAHAIYFEYMLRKFVFYSMVAAPPFPNDVELAEQDAFVRLLEFAHWHDWKDPLSELFCRFIGSNGKFTELFAKSERKSKQPIKAYLADKATTILETIPSSRITYIRTLEPEEAKIVLVLKFPFVPNNFEVVVSNHMECTNFQIKIADYFGIPDMEFKLCIGNNYFFIVDFALWQLGAEDGGEVLIFPSDFEMGHGFSQFVAEKIKGNSNVSETESSTDTGGSMLFRSFSESRYAASEVEAYFENALKRFVFKSHAAPAQLPTGVNLVETRPFLRLIEFGYMNNWVDPLSELFRSYMGSSETFNFLIQLHQGETAYPISSYVPEKVKRWLDNTPQSRAPDLIVTEPVEALIWMTVRFPYIARSFRIRVSNHMNSDDLWAVIAAQIDTEVDFKLCIGRNYFFRTTLAIWELGATDGGEVLVFLPNPQWKSLMIDTTSSADLSANSTGSLLLNSEE